MKNKAIEKKPVVKKPVVKKPVVKKVETPKAKSITEALFNFQSENINIPRNGTGRINGKAYKYAVLDDIMEIIKPFLQKNRIMITQLVEGTQLLTKIVHVDSGTEIIAPLPFMAPSSAQDLGSQITYLRRYAIVAALGLIVDQDVDGVKVESYTPTQAENSKLSAPDEEIVVPTTVEKHNQEPSESFTKAKSAILSASSEDAIEMIYGQVERSSRLTDEEKKDLRVILTTHSDEINGTVR